MALELNSSGDPTIYFNRGNVLLSENEFDKAIEDYEKAAKIAPQNPKYHHAKGIAYEALAA
jgi:tetratricopeptide (TPR) repeat protein